MKIFKMFDKDNSNTLTDTQMQQVMQQTKLDRQTCAKVWDLSNGQGADTFTKPMFFIAMHLMYKKRLNNSIELPASLPTELLVSSRDEEDNPKPSPPQA